MKERLRQAKQDHGCRHATETDQKHRLAADVVRQSTPEDDGRGFGQKEQRFLKTEMSVMMHSFKYDTDNHTGIVADFACVAVGYIQGPNELRCG